MPALLSSHRFWLLVIGGVVAMMIGLVVLFSDASDDVKMGALAALGWALKNLLGAAIESDGPRRMGDHRSLQSPPN